MRDADSRYNYADAVRDPISTYNSYGALSDNYDYSHYNDYDY